MNFNDHAYVKTPEKIPSKTRGLHVSIKSIAAHKKKEKNMSSFIPNSAH